jgi:hypothetical protein
VQTLTELYPQFDMHANQIKQWKDQLLVGAAGVFGPLGVVGLLECIEPNCSAASRRSCRGGCRSRLKQPQRRHDPCENSADFVAAMILKGLDRRTMSLPGKARAMSASRAADAPSTRQVVNGPMAT